MHRFFADPSQIKEKEILLTGTDVNHIRNVLRMRTGEEILVSNGQGTDYHCRLESIDDASVTASIMWRLDGNAELPVSITLYQGLPKGDKLEFIIQKSVELGAVRIVPVSTRRTIVKLDAKKEQAKRKRWMGISESAAKQSGRGIVPEVTKVMDFSEALREAESMDVCLIPYELAEGIEHTREVCASIKPGQSVGIFIGPEGGFEEEEVSRAIEAGAIPLTLGKRILRTETAGMALISVLAYLLEQ